MPFSPRLRRPEQRRDAWTAFATLFLLIGSHQMLETARDALFLDRLPASRLPIVYLLVAALSLVLTRAQAQVGGAWERRRALATWIGVAAGVTLTLRLLLPLGTGAVYALYAWSGIMTTLILVPFWTLLGELFTVTEAKRVFGMIGAGSILGAILGSAAAVVVARVFSAEGLLIVAAGGLALSALLPLRFRPAARAPEDAAKSPAMPWADLRLLFEKSYPRQVALVVVLAAVTLTTADYVFKSAAVTALAQGRLPTVESVLGGGEATLATFFAEVHLGLNVLSLGAQTIILPLLLRRLSVTATLSVLPVLLIAGGALAAVGGISAALLVKASDGSLKHSVHKTGLELLFVPMPEAARARVRAVTDVVGQRGGQALASIAILALGPFVPSFAFAIALSLFAGLWLFANLRLRGSYLDVFRGQLSHRRPLDAFPEVDVASLETLVATLDSDRDGEVTAALDVLEREGRSRLVPALILHHPSAPVVSRALELFGRSRRTRVRGHVERLFEHPSAEVRCAAAATGAALGVSRDALTRLEEDPDEGVRTVAKVHGFALDGPGPEADEGLVALTDHGTITSKIAVASALGHHADVGEAALARLLEDDAWEVRDAAASAITRRPPRPGLEKQLMHLLISERTRRGATEALIHLNALDALDEALLSPDTDVTLRAWIPQVMASTGRSDEVAELLSKRLRQVPDGRTQFEIVRALEKLTLADPDVSIDAGAIRETVEDGLRLGFRFLELRRALAADAPESREQRLPGQQLLLDALQDKTTNAAGRVLRLLGLLHPGENFTGIRRGLSSTNERQRSSSLELLDSLLGSPVKEGLLALVDDGPDAERLARGGAYRSSAALDGAGALRELLRERSPILVALASFYVGESRLTTLAPDLATVEAPMAGSDRDLALERLRGPTGDGDAG